MPAQRQGLNPDKNGRKKIGPQEFPPELWTCLKHCALTTLILGSDKAHVLLNVSTVTIMGVSAIVWIIRSSRAMAQSACMAIQLVHRCSLILGCSRSRQTSGRTRETRTLASPATFRATLIPSCNAALDSFRRIWKDFSSFLLESTKRLDHERLLTHGVR